MSRLDKAGRAIMKARIKVVPVQRWKSKVERKRARLERRMQELELCRNPNPSCLNRLKVKLARAKG